jgi:hypothetical protein
VAAAAGGDAIAGVAVAAVFYVTAIAALLMIILI